MAYDEILAERLRADLAGLAGITEQRMFGGLMFLQHGHMLAGLRGNGGLARVGPEALAQAQAIEGVGPAIMGGRRMKGFVALDAAAMADADRRLRVLAMAHALVATLPPRR